MQSTQTQHLPTSIKTIWRWRSYLSGMLGILLAASCWLLSIWFTSKFWLITAIVIFVINAIGTIAELALINYRWKFNTFLVDPQRFELHDGYFFRKQTLIPIAQIQNIKLEQGPLLQQKQLQAVTIVTAAGSHKIQGILEADSQHFKDLVMKLAQEARDDD